MTDEELTDSGMKRANMSYYSVLDGGFLVSSFEYSHVVRFMLGNVCVVAKSCLFVNQSTQGMIVCPKTALLLLDYGFGAHHVSAREMMVEL